MRFYFLYYNLEKFVRKTMNNDNRALLLLNMIHNAIVDCPGCIEHPNASLHSMTYEINPYGIKYRVTIGQYDIQIELYVGPRSNLRKLYHVKCIPNGYCDTWTIFSIKFTRSVAMPWNLLAKRRDLLMLNLISTTDKDRRPEVLFKDRYSKIFVNSDTDDEEFDWQVYNQYNTYPIVLETLENIYRYASSTHGLL